MTNLETAGKLYLVPTPIGNLGDMTYRAVEVLKSVDLILSEDTRTSGKLLKHFGIGTRQQSFHAHNEHQRVSGLAQQISEGLQVALISDAGTPGISDPGFLLIRACLQLGVEPIPLPGPSAILPALLLSGFPMDSFIFEGFLPHKKGKKTKLLELKEERRSVVFFESPHRLIKTLEQVNELLGEDRKVAVVREISKIHESCQRGEVSEVVDHFREKGVKGEIVLVIHGKE